MKSSKLSEEELLRLVIRAAQMFGYRVVHFRPCRTKKGWRTAIQGDGVGFCDLVLVKDRILYRELKGDDGRLSPAQRNWLMRLASAGADAAVWTADDWRSGEILEELRRERG